MAKQDIKNPTHSAGKGCYQWGGQKKYCGPGAKAKAEKQGTAINISKARKAGHIIPKKRKKKKGTKNEQISVPGAPTSVSNSDFRLR